jgi:minor extracellular serine protease Vpr
VRRLALLAPLLVVVTFSGTAAGSIDRTPRSIVEQAALKVRPADGLSATERERGNRVRVIMTLADPPLASAMHARGFAGLGVKRKLNVDTAFSRSYVSTLEAEQAKAIERVHDLIPSAVVSRRYEILVNGFAVSVPYARLPELVSSRIAAHVYPSLAYHLDLNRGPSVIGAPQFAAATGDEGQGVKVAVVDDGVDQEHPFLDPAGFSYPPGFPKGTSGSTTPKVIAARGFAGPGANSAPLDRDRSFHGTFVAGVIAGVKTDVDAGQPGFCSEANGGCHPAVKDVQGVAPRAYIGNYRVFNVPAPAPLGGCCSANSPEIVAAFEAAVRDGMDIINFSGGGPQADPRTDILIPAVSNVVRAGVVPIISAGNDRDYFGLGTAGSPATAPDAISVGAVANAHVFGPSLQVVSPGGLPRMPFAPTDTIPPAWISANQRLLDVGSISGVSRQLCDEAPGGSMSGAIALVSRGGCPYAS